MCTFARPRTLDIACGSVNWLTALDGDDLEETTLRGLWRADGCGARPWHWFMFSLQASRPHAIPFGAVIEAHRTDRTVAAALRSDAPRDDGVR